jgi:hypothetical protein
MNEPKYVVARTYDVNPLMLKQNMFHKNNDGLRHENFLLQLYKKPHL